MNKINIQPGHIARHTPRGAGSQGREAAIIDVAQDLLLRHLYEVGILAHLVFKGGTALRKLYAGNAGRFSLDLDFSVAAIGESADNVLIQVIECIENLSIGPFSYGVSERRGKWFLNCTHPFGPDTGVLKSKLDISPPPWISPVERDWVPMPIHATYGEPELPRIVVMRLEENIAEKVARLNRVTPARDLYDLRWIMTNASLSCRLDLALIRRLSVLKIWCDAHGISADGTHWKPGHEAFEFDPDRWLRDRSKEDIDIDDIGALAVPIPNVKEMSEVVSMQFRFLKDLTDSESVVAQIRGQDRALVLKMLAELPCGLLNGIKLY
jgi:predicted nucleotidyltransferase component of viral defense system